MSLHWVQWGDVPAWIGAIGTSAALLMAAITYRGAERDGSGGRPRASMWSIIERT